MENTDQLFVSKRVEYFYQNEHLNCAQTSLKVLAEKFEFSLSPQIIDGSIGLNGAGQFRAQCGLVEGVLIFLGVYLKSLKMDADNIQKTCNSFASEFEKKFGSLSCRVLRPNGFNASDPPNLCEDLSKKSILFAIEFISPF